MEFFQHNWKTEKVNEIYDGLKEVYKNNPETLKKIEDEKQLLIQYEPIRFTKEVENRSTTYSKGAKYIWDITSFDNTLKIIKNEAKNAEYKNNLKFHLKILTDRL